MTVRSFVLQLKEPVNLGRQGFLGLRAAVRSGAPLAHPFR